MVNNLCNATLCRRNEFIEAASSNDDYSQQDILIALHLSCLRLRYGNDKLQCTAMYNSKDWAYLKIAQIKQRFTS